MGFYLRNCTMLELHLGLALVSVSGFVLRVGWTFTDPEMLKRKVVRIAPHVVDTLLLVTGFIMAMALADGLLTDWLVAKLVALVGYIGFGVMALRGQGALRFVGIASALACVVYIVLVAFSRSVIPL